MVRSKQNNNVYLQNRLIINHLSNVIEKNDFNRFVTVSFVYSRFGTPLKKSDIVIVSNLMRDYFNKVSQKLNGRTRKWDTTPKTKTPAVGFPEYRSRSGGSGFLHFHCLLRIPDEQIEFFDMVTKDFWRKVVRNTIGYAPRIDNRGAYNPKGAAFYSNKNIEDGFTLENAVFEGISLS